MNDVWQPRLNRRLRVVLTVGLETTSGSMCLCCPSDKRRSTPYQTDSLSERAGHASNHSRQAPFIPSSIPLLVKAVIVVVVVAVVQSLGS